MTISSLLPTSATAVFLGLVLLAWAAAPASASGSFSHDDWTTVLEEFVDEKGNVDYQRLSRGNAAFERYVERVETQSPESDPQLFRTRDEQLAYYINAYNALVFKGVLSRGPEEESVWSGLISGFNFFQRMKITVGGDRTTLKALEDDVIREGFGDPRIHAALNCASIGCPRLPQEAFLPETLNDQLDAAMREFVNDERHVLVDAGAKTARLSKIFDWFQGDFLDYLKRQGQPDATILDYLNLFRADDEQIPADYKVSYLPYDKGVNKQ